jgi:hypothetical protein
MEIYCCGCNREMDARLTDGLEVYPHRPDLQKLTFWKCDACGNYVGCHHKTDEPTKPLGVIPTPALKRARQNIHLALDPLWQKQGRSRKKIYRMLSSKLGYQYHTAEIRCVSEAQKVLGILREYAQSLA